MAHPQEQQRNDRRQCPENLSLDWGHGSTPVVGNEEDKADAWSGTFTDEHRGSLRLGPVLSAGEITCLLAQVIEMSHREARQAFVARVAIPLGRPPPQDAGRRAGQDAVQSVDLGQQRDIGFGINPGRNRPWATGRTSDPFQVAQDKALLRTLEASALETP